MSKPESRLASSGSRSKMLSSTLKKSFRRPLSIIASVSNTNLKDLLVSDSPNSTGEYDSFDSSSPVRPRHSRTSSWKRRSTSFADLVSAGSWSSENNTKKVNSSVQSSPPSRSSSFSSTDTAFSSRSIRSPDHIPRTTPRIPSDSGKRVSRLSPTYEEDDVICDIEPSLAQLVSLSNDESTYTYQPQLARREALYYKNHDNLQDYFAATKYHRTHRSSSFANTSFDSNASYLSKTVARGVYLGENGQPSSPNTSEQSIQSKISSSSLNDGIIDNNDSIFGITDENFNPFADEDMPVKSDYFRTDFMITMDY